MSNKQKNIISNFYLIREDNNPVYVGYTNRPVKQRFREHIKEKEFTGNVTVEELDSMTFPFTWDINTINQYAQEVSNRETSLIVEYGTTTSIWQKGISGHIGGQTWADIKHFVNINRDNPKFEDMDENEILAYLDRDNMIKIYMCDFVSNANDPIKIYMQNFVNRIEDPIKDYMQGFINSANDPVKIYMHNFVNHINDPIKIYIQNFVNRIEDPVKDYMRDFVSHVNDPVNVYMSHFVSTINDPAKVYMKNFVSNANDPIKDYMNNFVNHINDPVKIYMQSFISNAK